MLLPTFKINFLHHLEHNFLSAATLLQKKKSKKFSVPEFLNMAHLLTMPTLFHTHYKQPIKIQPVNVRALFNYNKNIRSLICQHTIWVNRVTPCCECAGVRLLAMATAAKIHHMAQLPTHCSHSCQQWTIFIREVPIIANTKLSHAQRQQHILQTNTWNPFLKKSW